MPEIERANGPAGGRAGGRDGRTVCGMKKIVREKSECSYQSAMQTRGFASVMPGEREREREKKETTWGDADILKLWLAHEERDISFGSDNCVV